MSTAVTTRSFDNTRRNANLKETKLTQSYVRQTGIRRLFSLTMKGDARGVEGMPLIAPTLHMNDGQLHDVLFACTMANAVYAWDANDGSLLWQRQLGMPIVGSKQIDAYQINDHWGILSTPVINLDKNTLYCVAWSSPDGSVAKATFSLHSLALRDGTAVAAPLSLEGAVYQPGGGIGPQQFRAAARKQRCGLTLTHVQGVKTVFIAAGSISESLASNRGWVIAIDVTANTAPRIAAAWTSTARYSGGGIWMGAQGLAAINNKLYFMTGNGAFDGITDFGECLVELTYQPATGGKPASLRATDHFSPFSDAGRDGQDPTKVEIGVVGDDVPSNTNGWDDMDLGSGGLVVVPELGFAIGAGKDGIAYVLKLGHFGKTHPADFAPDKIAANYARCASPPIWFTYYNPSLTPTPTNLTDLNVLYGGRTHHQHSTPVVFRSSLHGWMVFNWGENGTLRGWALDAAGRLTYLACSAEVASPECPPPGGMPGGMITLSANGDLPGTAIVWACVPYFDANKVVSPGRLLAYDAENFGTFPDGSKRLMPLWDSQTWAIQFTHSKFNVPVAANGKVYVATYSGTIDVYG